MTRNWQKGNIVKHFTLWQLFSPVASKTMSVWIPTLIWWTVTISRSVWKECLLLLAAAAAGATAENQWNGCPIETNRLDWEMSWVKAVKIIKVNFLKMLFAWTLCSPVLEHFFVFDQRHPIGERLVLHTRFDSHKFWWLRLDYVHRIDNSENMKLLTRLGKSLDFSHTMSGVSL